MKSMQFSENNTQQYLKGRTKFENNKEDIPEIEL